jgi:hypothetical protein
MSRYPRYNEEASSSVGLVIRRILAIALPVLVVAYWLIAGWWLDSIAQNFRNFLNGIWFSWFFPNGLNLFAGTPMFTVLASIVIFALVFFMVKSKKTIVASAIILGLVSVYAIAYQGIWKSEEDGARHYLATTKFVVSDPNKVPDLLTKMKDSSEAMVEITQGNMPSGWLPRVASATGANKVISRTSDAVSNTELMTDTITYIYGEGKSGQWTAIRDGKNQQSVYGVATWNGSGENVNTCEFTGANKINKAFGGWWGTNLTNAIAGKDPLFTYDESDIWGYCDGDKPIIVIPGTKTVGYGTRTVDQANGVMTIVGSPSGEPIITHDDRVNPGEYPGPVYPQRLVNQQLSNAIWAAGRHLKMHGNFGLETTDVSTQGGNNQNYLLKSESDGRLYWVTPLKPRATDSQTLIAFSVTPADSINTDQLNEQKIYVFNNNDPRIVNLDTLESVVTDQVKTTDPGFFTGEKPGKIVEFLPVSDDKWQVFAEVNGRVKYRIDVTVGSRIATNVVLIDKEVDAPQQGSNAAAMTCDDPSSLNSAKLAECLSKLANELQKRQTESTK